MEEFKKIFADYEIGTCGTARSLKWGKVKVLNPSLDNDGYLHVSLMIGGKPKSFVVHRLVALAFIPNPENKPCVNHINGIKTDNRVENLEWCTQSENQQHAFVTGLQPQGEDRSNAKLTNEQVIYIRNNSDALNTVELAAMFGVTDATISYIQRGKTYKTAAGKVRGSKKTPRIPDGTRAEIRRLYAQGGVTQAALAEQFGVAQITIWKIIHETNQ